MVYIYIYFLCVKLKNYLIYPITITLFLNFYTNKFIFLIWLLHNLVSQLLVMLRLLITIIQQTHTTTHTDTQHSYLKCTWNLNRQRQTNNETIIIIEFNINNKNFNFKQSKIMEEQMTSKYFSDTSFIICVVIL